MPPETVYVTTHLHLDGPVPGPHSLLTLTSAAHALGGVRVGGPISTFHRNVRELPGASPHPLSLQTWRDRPEDWLTTRRGSCPPAVATSAYARWIDTLPAAPTLVADPIQPDYPFLYWYLQRFTGHWPFARTSTDADLCRRLDATSLCALRGCRSTSLARAG